MWPRYFGSRNVYAIIADGSHQYRVEEGTTFEIQIKDLADGTETITFDQVLVVGDTGAGARIGQPTVEGASVTASVIREFKGDKIIIQNFRRRKNSASKTGHRQRHLLVKVDKINA